MWKAYIIVADGYMMSAFLACYCSEGIMNSWLILSKPRVHPSQTE